MKDPYQVLGVSPNATDEEIKKAYRELAKKYHHDAYVNNPLKELAAAKMKEINEAYDTVTKQRAAGGSGAGGYTGGGYSGGSGQYARVRQLINAGRVSEAETILSRVPMSDRNAEWNYLMGHVMARKNWIGEARRYFETACNMDPSNGEYRSALNNMSRNAYSSPYRNVNTSQNDCDFCDICTGMMCMNLLCNCR